MKPNLQQPDELLSSNINFKAVNVLFTWNIFIQLPPFSNPRCFLFLFWLLSSGISLIFAWHLICSPQVIRSRSSWKVGWQMSKLGIRVEESVRLSLAPSTFFPREPNSSWRVSYGDRFYFKASPIAFSTRLAPASNWPTAERFFASKTRHATYPLIYSMSLFGN